MGTSLRSALQKGALLRVELMSRPLQDKVRGNHHVKPDAVWPDLPKPGQLRLSLHTVLASAQSLES